MCAGIRNLAPSHVPDLDLFSHETYISAKCSPPQAQARLPLANENPVRKGRHQAPPTQAPSSSLGLARSPVAGAALIVHCEGVVGSPEPIARDPDAAAGRSP